MKSKKFISIVLTLALVLSSIQLACGVVASAASYDDSVLDYMIANHDYFRQDRYTEESFANYTEVLAASTAVSESTTATAGEINAAASNLATAEAALTLRASTYKSKLNFIYPNTVLSGSTVTIEFKDALDNEYDGISIEAENATATDVVMGENGYYSTDVTATGATGDIVTVTFTYVFDGVEYTAYAYILIADEGTQSDEVSKTILGAMLVREFAKNRQASDYSGGFQTYTSVLKSSMATYDNVSSTQSKVDRAIDSINQAISGLVDSYADYSLIYSQIAYANELNPDNYNTFTDVTNAIALVEYDLPITQQDYVDAMADNIQTALDALTLKVARYTVVCQTADGVQLSSKRYDGTRTYVVRVTAPVFPGYAADYEYQTVTLSQDDSTVTFVYNPVTYYAYFNANGGSCDTASKTLTYDAEYGELPTPTRDGYSFIGWFSDPFAGEQIYADTMVTINYVETLYAHWSDVESYTFKFDSGLGTACEDLVATYGSEITLPTPTRYGYQFLGWFYQPEFTDAADYTTMPDIGDTGAVKTLYAKWIERTYTIALDPGENGVVSTPEYSVTYGSTYGELPEPSLEGHTFAGWFTAAEGGTQVVNATPVELDSLHTLYAHYTVNRYTLYFDMDGGTEIASVTQDYGTPVVLPSQPEKEYYLFGGWTLNGQPFELTTMPEGNVTIKAVWTLNTVCNYYMEPYKTIDGVEVPATSIKPGDVLKIKVSIKTNYPAGQGIFGILFDKRVFSLSSTTVSRFCTANTASPYLATLSAKTITGTANYAATNWSSFFEGDEVIDGTNFQCMRLQTQTFKAANTPIVISEKSLVFTLTINVNDTLDLSVLNGAIRLDPRMCRTPENNLTKYPTCVALQKLNDATSTYSTADTVNLAPNCDNAMISLPIMAEDSELGAASGSTTVVDYEEGYVYGLAEQLTLSSFATDYAKILGTGTIECNDSVLHTGSIIRVMNSGVCRAKYTVIIFGDIDSNGTADGTDSFIVNMIVNGMISADSLTAAQKMAADPNHDGVINEMDAALLEDAGLLKQIVAQTIPV